METSSFTPQRLIEYFETKDFSAFPTCAVLMDGPLDIGSHKLASGKVAGLKFQTYKEDLAAVRAPGMGAAAVAYAIEILAALGVRQILHLGTAGSLDQNLLPGQLLVVTGAIADEGVSREYGFAEQARLGSNGPKMSAPIESYWPAPVKQGTVWSTSAVFRETPSKIRKFREMGAIAVDMESSASLAVASALNLQVLNLRVISDAFDDLGNWIPGFKTEAVKAARRKLWEMALNGDWR